MAGLHSVGTLTLFIIINVLFQTVYSTPIDHLQDDTESAQGSDEMDGGLKQMSVEDEDVQLYARMGMLEISKVFEGANEPVMVNIESATCQIVAGTLCKVHVTVGTTDCLKGTKQNCQLLDDSETVVYEISAWSRPWLSSLQIRVERIADPARESIGVQKVSRSKRSRPIFGAPDSMSIDDEDVQLYARMGMLEISKISSGANEPVLVNIESATCQVVAGTLCKIHVTVGTSDCPKGTKQNCQLLDDSETVAYEISAWSRPWLTAVEIVVKSITTATDE